MTCATTTPPATVVIQETPTQVHIQGSGATVVTSDDRVSVATVGLQGPPGVASIYGVLEVPAGVVNGVNTEFELSSTPRANTLLLFLNGLAQKQDTGLGGDGDFTLTDDLIHFLAGSEPQTGDQLLAQYLLGV